MFKFFLALENFFSNYLDRHRNYNCRPLIYVLYGRGGGLIKNNKNIICQLVDHSCVLENIYKQ